MKHEFQTGPARTCPNPRRTFKNKHNFASNITGLSSARVLVPSFLLLAEERQPKETEPRQHPLRVFSFSD